MKKIAFYPGCLIQTEQYAYELSIRNTFPLLDIELVDMSGFSCCGETVKSVNQMITLYLSARNLAISEKDGLDLFVPCPRCHTALSECKHVLNNDIGIRDRINSTLSGEGLKYEGSVNIMHTIDLLHDHVGIEEITKRIKKPFDDLKIATHYGCNLIRPGSIGRPADSENPQKMEAILHALGVKTGEYAEKLDCCGGPLLVNLPETSLAKTGQKIQAIFEQGFDGMALACPWCHKMFDSKQKKACDTVGSKARVPVFYITQLLGMAMGIEDKKSGLELNLSPVDSLRKREVVE